MTGKRKDDRVDFLRVAYEGVCAFTRNDVPDTDGGVVGSRDKGASTGSKSTNGVVVSVEEGAVVGVLRRVLWGGWEGERRRHLGLGGETRVFWVVWTGKSPNAESVVSASCDDEGTFRPFFLDEGLVV